MSDFVCRGCGGSRTSVLLDMGKLPLANSFVRDEGGTEDRFQEHLTLVMCETCTLIQIREAVPREHLFGSYLWVTGTSETTKTYAKWFAQRLRERYPDRIGALLVEVASNDGFFLRHYREAGFDILGVDPSNLAEEADRNGLPSIREFFGKAVAARIRAERGRPQLMVARNVLGHSSELRDLVAGVKELLAPDGALVLETPYAYLLRAELQYDTIFHEHLSYLTIGSTANLLGRFGLKITDISFVPMNGGSYLCEVVHEESPLPRADQAFIDFETLIDLNTPRGWRGFTQAVEAQRAGFVALLRDLARQGKRVAGYGAAAKCMTMLNYCGITKDLMALIGDANPRKQGLLCPGVRIPVVSPDAVVAFNPDYVMIGAWNFKEEIIRQFRIKGYRNKFIIPLPIPEVVE